MSTLAFEAGELRRWLFDVALPLWWTVGADRGGGFHEAIDLAGSPAPSPHRARTIARQVFVYGEAGRLGWDGPWREAARHALDYLRSIFVRPDGTIASVVDLDGHVGDAPFDLYDQAFGLLALAAATAHSVSARAAAAMRSPLRAALERHVAHRAGRLFSRTALGRLPQRANPHMHLLEGALAWMAIDADPGWRRMADDIAAFCLDKFIDPGDGALREIFAADWSPAPGHRRAHRLRARPSLRMGFPAGRWAAMTGRPRPMRSARLIAFADAHGVDAKRGVVVNAVLTRWRDARSGGAAVGAGRAHPRLRDRSAAGRRGAHRRRDPRPPPLPRDPDTRPLVRSTWRVTTTSSTSRRAPPASIISSARSAELAAQLQR